MALMSTQIRSLALDHYRRLVALLYREVGVIRKSHHAQVFAKIRQDPLFQPTSRKDRARQLYKLTLSEMTPSGIEAPFVRQSGLTVQDIHEAFVNGNWLNYSGGYSYGGPRWALIAETALKLRAAIEAEAYSEIEDLLQKVKGLKHNNGLIIAKYPQLD